MAVSFGRLRSRRPIVARPWDQARLRRYQSWKAARARCPRDSRQDAGAAFRKITNAAGFLRRRCTLERSFYRGASSSNPCSIFSWHSMQWRVHGTASRRLALISLPQ